MIEIWKDIRNYEGMYQVSNLGRIKSLKRPYVIEDTILKPQSDKDGYSVVSLSKSSKRKSFKIHRLVANHFIPNPNKWSEVNHIDTVRDNNRVDNLEWVTSLANKHHSNSHRIIQINECGEIVNKYPSINITRQYGYVPECIHRVLRGERTHHRGYLWRYADD